MPQPATVASQSSQAANAQSSKLGRDTDYDLGIWPFLVAGLTVALVMARITWSTINGLALSTIPNIVAAYPDAAPVTGWYGPGAWLSFITYLYFSLWRTACVAIRGSTRASKAERWDAELLPVLVYAVVAAVDLVYKCIELLRGPTCPINPQLLPALCAPGVVVHTTFGFSILGVILSLVGQVRASNSTRRTALWGTILLICLGSMIFFERTLSLRRALALSLPTLGDPPINVFHGLGPFALRLAFLPEMISIAFAWGFPWKSYAIFHALIFVVCLILTTFITFVDHRPRDAPAALGFTPLFFAGGLCNLALILIVWLWLAACGALVPASAFFPQSGIRLAEPGQVGTLALALLVLALRASPGAQRWLRARGWLRRAEPKCEDSEKEALISFQLPSASSA